jgi:hypothetical protein
MESFDWKKNQKIAQQSKESNGNEQSIDQYFDKESKEIIKKNQKEVDRYIAQQSKESNGNEQSIDQYFDKESKETIEQNQKEVDRYISSLQLHKNPFARKGDVINDVQENLNNGNNLGATASFGRGSI